MTQRVARKEADRLYSRLNAGEESKVPGLLEQWLREGKMSEEEALNESVGMFLVGVDTVIIYNQFYTHYYIDSKPKCIFAPCCCQVSRGAGEVVC